MSIEASEAKRAERMGVSKEQFRKTFPHLAEEMENGESDTSIVVEDETNKEAPSKKFDGYNPDVNDFLCRCDNAQQAEEIIAYLQKRGEISQEVADKLRKQLKRKGVRSFGPKKGESHYLKQTEL